MDNLTDDYAKADEIFAQYQQILWELIEDAKTDKSLLKLAGKLQEVAEWEKED